MDSIEGILGRAGDGKTVSGKSHKPSNLRLNANNCCASTSVAPLSFLTIGYLIAIVATHFKSYALEESEELETSEILISSIQRHLALRLGL